MGCLAMLLGGIDPLEGSPVVLAGSGLFALAAYLGRVEWPVLRGRVVIFLLVAVGVAALWGLTAWGGIGGKSGRPMGWAWLVLPYPLGWAGSFWSRGAPRWYTQLGLVSGLWYMAICYLGVTRPLPRGAFTHSAVIALGVLGLLTAAGCAWRLWRTRNAAPALSASPP